MKLTPRTINESYSGLFPFYGCRRNRFPSQETGSRVTTEILFTFYVSLAPGHQGPPLSWQCAVRRGAVSSAPSTIFALLSTTGSATQEATICENRKVSVAFASCPATRSPSASCLTVLVAGIPFLEIASAELQLRPVGCWSGIGGIRINLCFRRPPRYCEIRRWVVVIGGILIDTSGDLLFNFLPPLWPDARGRGAEKFWGIFLGKVSGERGIVLFLCRPGGTLSGGAIEICCGWAGVTLSNPGLSCLQSQKIWAKTHSHVSDMCKKLSRWVDDWSLCWCATVNLTNQRPYGI